MFIIQTQTQHLILQQDCSPNQNSMLPTTETSLMCWILWSCFKKNSFITIWISCSRESLAIKSAEAGIHFLSLICSTWSVMSSRGQHRQLRLNKWQTQCPLSSSLPGPKCFGERRSLETTTSKWSRYLIDFIDLRYCRIISKKVDRDQTRAESELTPYSP